MPIFKLPSAIFPENSITRVERAYQQTIPNRLPRRFWINRILTGLVIIYAFLQLGILFVAALAQTNPIPVASQLLLFSALLMIIVIYYHFYLMFQAITISANSIMREKEYKKSWVALLRSGVQAREIVRGKWWVTFQNLLWRYLLLGVLRVGATAGVGTIILAVLVVEFDSTYILLPHPLTILMASLLIIIFTVANLGVSAACGIMSAAVGKVTSPAIEFGFISQAVMSFVPAIILIVVFNRPSEPVFHSIYYPLTTAGISLIDNGFTLLSFPLYVSFDPSNVGNYSPILPLRVDWMIAALLTLVLYVVVIGFALWLAERSVKRSIITPSS